MEAIILRGNPARNIGIIPDVNTIREVPKSGCSNIKYETSRAAKVVKNQSENLILDSFLHKYATNDKGSIRRKISEG